MSTAGILGIAAGAAIVIAAYAILYIITFWD